MPYRTNFFVCVGVFCFFCDFRFAYCPPATLLPNPRGSCFFSFVPLLFVLLLCDFAVLYVVFCVFYFFSYRSPERSLERSSSPERSLERSSSYHSFFSPCFFFLHRYSSRRVLTAKTWKALPTMGKMTATGPTRTATGIRLRAKTMKTWEQVRGGGVEMVVPVGVDFGGFGWNYYGGP